jgi:hypothetical protein
LYREIVIENGSGKSEKIQFKRKKINKVKNPHQQKVSCLSILYKYEYIIDKEKKKKIKIKKKSNNLLIETADFCYHFLC